MAGHTPGPWRVEESSHKQEFSHWIGSVSQHVMPRQSTIAAVVNAGAESDANAQLIAAAPELLDACKNVAGWVAEYDERLTEAQRASIAIVKRAIAKAEGR